MQTQQPMFDRALLIQRRNRVAKEAARHDFLLTEVAADLVDRLSLVKRNFSTVLDLGCHHGLLGRAIQRHAPSAHVISLDPSAGLLAHAAAPKVLGHPVALPFSDASFDLIASGLFLQFECDLARALGEARRVLRPDGLFLGTLLGGRTLHELRTVFLMAEAELEGGASPRVAPGAELGDLSQLFARAKFALPVADAHELKATFPSARALITELKAMGAGNVLTNRRRTPIRRATFERALALYQERFSATDGRPDGRIVATFELMTLTGWAAHPSQQKPLKPGSATHRLADALKR